MRQPIPKRFSGDGSAPPRLSIWFSAPLLLHFRSVCLAAARRSRAALVYAKHTPWCQSGEKSPVFFPEIYGEVEPALGNRSRLEAESVT